MPDFVASEGGPILGGDINGGSEEQNMEVSSVLFTKGSHYTGSSYNGTVIEASGSGDIIVDEGAIVDLKPKGDGSYGAGNAPSGGVAQGMYLHGTNNVYVRKNASVNITLQKKRLYGSTWIYG